MRKATTDELTYLANHPGIADAMGLRDDQHISMANFYTNNEGNIALSCPLGAMAFAYVGDGEYECHWLFIPGGGGKEIKACATKMHDEMFTKHNARVIKGYPPRGNRAVRVMGTALGYTKIAGTENTDDFGRICDIYEMRREQWAI